MIGCSPFSDCPNYLTGHSPWCSFFGGTTPAPTEAQIRKGRPVATGVLKYFPDALLAVAEVSKAGNDQHNPGQPLHWAKEKSTDEPDALTRHIIDWLKGERWTKMTITVDGVEKTIRVRTSAQIAWRALALCQRELDAEIAEETKAA